jgi:serine/threonine protein kinase
MDRFTWCASTSKAPTSRGTSARSAPLALSCRGGALRLQAAEAVAETHSHGIILREMQPSHLFLTQRPGGAPLVKVIDFGTAKLMNATRPRRAWAASSRPPTMFGLSPYSSPELVRKAKNVDGRTDVWSLGAILYELLTGKPPFHRRDGAMLMLQITQATSPSPSTQMAPRSPCRDRSGHRLVRSRRTSMGASRTCTPSPTR